MILGGFFFFFQFWGFFSLVFLFVLLLLFMEGWGTISTQLCPKNNMYKTLKCDVGMCECVFVNVWHLNLCLLEVSEFFPFSSGSICYKICK